MNRIPDCNGETSSPDGAGPAKPTGPDETPAYGRRHHLKIGASFDLDGTEQVFVGTTGNGRYAFVRADDFGILPRSAPRVRIANRLDTEIKLGLVRTERRSIADRRGGRARHR